MCVINEQEKKDRCSIYWTHVTFTLFLPFNFQILEQEKHGLRRRLDTLESEYESRIQELQTDLTNAKKQLEDHQNNVRNSEQDKSRMIQELMEQNHRLTQELKEVSFDFFMFLPPHSKQEESATSVTADLLSIV